HRGTRPCYRVPPNSGRRKDLLTPDSVSNTVILGPPQNLSSGGASVSRRPVIGIATQTQDAMPGQLPRCWIMSQRYVQVLSSLGAVRVLIPLLPGDTATLREIYDRLNGLFLTGGVDVDPSRYGEAKLEKCGHTDPDRDAVEFQL